MVEIHKNFPSGHWVLKAYDTERDDISESFVKSVMESFSDIEKSIGTVCVVYQNGELVAYAQFNTEKDFASNMELSIALENYEEAYLFDRFWQMHGQQILDRKRDAGALK